MSYGLLSEDEKLSWHALNHTQDYHTNFKNLILLCSIYFSSPILSLPWRTQTALYVSSLKFHVLQMNQLVKNSWLIPTTKFHELPHLCGLMIIPLLIYLLENFLISLAKSSSFSFWSCMREDLVIDLLLKWKSWSNSRFLGLHSLTTWIAGMYHGSSYILWQKALQVVLGITGSFNLRHSVHL